MSIEDKIKKDVPLAPSTTFKIGGPAKLFIEIRDKEDLPWAMEWARENKEEIFIFGGGSNVLVNDRGVDGLVIKIKNDEIKVRSERLDCGAGAGLAQASRLAVSQGLAGLEWAAGIPGATVGGAVVGNAGAFGTSMSALVETVEVFNLKKKRFETLSNRDCKFDYRHSLFKESGDYLIWGAVLKMAKENKEVVEQTVNKYNSFRFQSQPRLPSAGSVFKNLSFAKLQEANANLADMAEEEGKVKNGMLGAGWLVELAGLKGKTIGGAKVSLEHANFIVNTGKATAEDVVMLISYIKQQVRDRFKVQLQEEVRYLGF